MTREMIVVEAIKSTENVKDALELLEMYGKMREMEGGIDAYNDASRRFASLTA